MLHFSSLSLHPLRWPWIIRIVGSLLSWWSLSLRLKSEVASVVSTLCEPMDCSPRGSSVHRILRARILVRVAVPSSRGCSRPRDQIHISRGPCNAGGLLTTEPPGKPFLSLTAEFMLQEQLVPCPQWIKTAPSGDGRERSRKSFLFLCISTVLLTQVCTRWAFLRACRGVSVGRVYEKMHNPRAV